jgi:hypothetical protein
MTRAVAVLRDRAGALSLLLLGVWCRAVKRRDLERMREEAKRYG